MRRIGRLLEDCNPSGFGRDLLQYFQPLHRQFRGQEESPVVLPPGRARPAIKPLSNGSAAAPMTIGVLCVALCAARIAAVPPTTMISTFARSRWPISEGIDSTSSP